MSSAAQAYARTAEITATPREIEAQALIKAAQKLQSVLANWGQSERELGSALTYNRKLWSIFITEALRENNPQPVEIRQNIANIGVFVMRSTVEIQLNPETDKIKALIDINHNIAAGLRGRG